MATKKGHPKKSAPGKKSTRSRKVVPPAQRDSTGAAGHPELANVDLMAMATAPGQSVDQHPRPVSTPLVIPPPLLPPILLDECGAGIFTCQRSSISTTGSNNDETDFPDRVGNYHKGLPHNGLGEVVQTAYQTLLAATVTPTPGEFRSSGRR